MNYSFKSLDYLLLTFLILPHYPVLFTSVSALCQYLFETNCPILLIALLSVSVMGSDIAIRHHAWLSTLYQPVGCMPSKLLRIYFKTKQNCSRPQLLSCGMLSVSKICFLFALFRIGFIAFKYAVAISSEWKSGPRYSNQILFELDYPKKSFYLGQNCITAIYVWSLF